MQRRSVGGSAIGDILDFSETLVFLLTVPKALALHEDLSRSKCKGLREKSLRVLWHGTGEKRERESSS